MIILGENLLMARVEDILYKIRRETGYISDIKLNGNKALITCPSHKNGRESKPSCLINLSDNGEYKAGDSFCFTCHTFHSLPKLVGICYQQNEAWGMKWLFENFASGEVENRSEFFNIPSRVKSERKTYYEDLEQYRYIHPYMYKRHLTDEIIAKYDIGWDEKLDAITFPIHDVKGNLVFVAKRSVKSKTFYLPTDLDKPLCYLHEVQKYFPETKEIYIVESLFNALTLAKWGKPAIALLGTGTSHQMEELKKLPYRKFIIALDSDMAGNAGAKKIKYALKDRLTERLLLKDKSKDINDYGGTSWEDFQNYLEK